MNLFVVTCNFNDSRTLIDCAFKNEAVAKAYADELNGDQAKAAARCKKVIELREGEEAVKFLVEGNRITFAVLPVELK